MKKSVLVLVTTLTVFIVFGFSPEPQDPEMPSNEWIIAPRFLKLKEGVNKEEVREFMVNVYLPIYRHWAGWNAMLGEPQYSGGWGTYDKALKEKADFILVYFFDSKSTMNHYFPPGGEWSEEVTDVIKEHQSTWDKFESYFDQDKYTVESYLMYASAK